MTTPMVYVVGPSLALLPDVSQWGWAVILNIVAATLSLLAVLMTSRIWRKHPTLLSVSILGFPGTGKTVYLTVLFDALQRAAEPGIHFYPYGRQTIERVSESLTTLSSGRWLPKTEIGTVFPYRAKASVGTGLFRSNYTVEIGDWAGEQMGELNPADSRWLHKTEYFKYVLQSDAVLLAIDSTALVNEDLVERERIQNAFVAAVQVLAEEKGATESRKLATPVGLLFMKSDAVSRTQRYQLPSVIPRLIDVCETRCQSFRIFSVSSTGPLGAAEQPPQRLAPEGVVEPISWILKQRQPLISYVFKAARLLGANPK